MAKNYYSILGVSRTASDREIRQAYRKLARRYHPDLNPGQKEAEEKFKAINEAYGVLSAADNREKYDQFGEDWKYADRIRRRGNGIGHGSFVGGRYSGLAAEKGFDKVFREFFRRGSGSEGFSSKRSSVEHSINITLQEAYSGASRVLDIIESGASSRRLEVKIPPGVEEGSRIHIPSTNHGGDIYILVKIKPHRLFQRKGKNLYVEVLTPLVDAILGAEVRVPTLTGVVALKIHPETQNGQSFRLKGQGMPGKNNSGSRGDLYATVKVVMPTGLSDRGRDLFRELKAMGS